MASGSEGRMGAVAVCLRGLRRRALEGDADAAGFKADDFPLTLLILDIDARVTIAAGERALGSSGLHLSARGYNGSLAVKTHFSIRDFETAEVDPAGVEVRQGFVFGLECAVSGDGCVVVGQE